MRASILAALLLALPVAAAVADDPNQPAGQNVLVVYQADDDDRDASGKPDSLELAEYYAARRAVPAENLLGLTLKKDNKLQSQWDYRDFHQRILTPVAAKLADKSADGRPLAERVHFIVTLPNLPMAMNTGHKADKDSKDWFAKTTRRSVDQYLISIEANVKAGVDESANSPGPGRSGPLGANGGELALSLFGAYGRPDRARSFIQMRREQPAQFNYHLVTRLGQDLAGGRDMLDTALYAERYLRLPGDAEKLPWRPEIWLDQKYKFASDQVAAMARAVAVVRGLPGSPFAAGKGLQRVWPLVIDNQLPEIGMEQGDRQHPPTVTATIGLDSKDAKAVDAQGVVLEATKAAGLPKDAPSALYFPIGGQVTNGQVTATVVGVDAHRNRLLLDSTKGLASGDGLTWSWPGRFPTDNCFVFYGFYGLGQYEDVFKFPPGALGVHVDSSCMTWAGHAMRRGIAATFGVTTEPLSAGIPYGDQLLLALGSGYTWAEAVYGSLRLAQRWAGVAFGDPLYAPFRSLQKIDETAPALEKVNVRPVGAGAVVLSVALAAGDADQQADVALFRLEHGPTDRLGQVIDFFDWPDPDKSKNVKGRRFGYSRHFSTRLTGLEKGKPYHYRLTARDPAGLETAVSGTFVP